MTAHAMSSRIEDAWDPTYLVAVAAQLALDGGPDQKVTDRLDAELAALRANGATVSPLIRDVRVPEVDVAPLRDAVAAYRAAGRASYDPLEHAVAWLFCDADWPLW